MSFDTMLAIAAALSVVVAFAGVLISGDFQARPAKQKTRATSQRRRSF